MADLQFDITRSGSHLVVKVAGRLDAQTATALQDGIGKALEGIDEITFDVPELEFISSAGLRILLAAYKLMAKRVGSMRIINATGEVMSVLEMSGFASLFDVQ